MEETSFALTPEQREKSKRNINREGMAYSMMAGFGDTYVPAALVSIGASNFAVGLLASLPQLFGAFLQFLSLSVLRVMKSRKKMVIAGSLIQALSWLIIAGLVLWAENLAQDAIIIIFSLGFGASTLVNPAWSSWVADIIDQKERARFFADRNRIMQIVLFVTVFFAGMAISQMQVLFGASLAFSVIFAFAFITRLASVFFHMETEDVPYDPIKATEIRLRHLILLPSYKNELWFLTFVATMGFGVQFASPFFTPYMLNNLGMDVWALGALTTINIVSMVASYRYWGEMIDKYGNRTALIATSFAVPFVPLLWLLSSDFWALALFQAFSGFAWAGYNLSVFNTALSMVSRELRLSFISKYNAANMLASAAGAFCGGAFLATFRGFSLFGFSDILLVMLISGIMRLVIALAFAPRIVRSRDIANKTIDRSMIIKLVAVYPTQGAVEHVLNGWDFTRKIVREGANAGKTILRKSVEATGKIVAAESRKIAKAINRKERL